MPNEEIKNELTATGITGSPEGAQTETQDQEPGKGGWRELFRTALNRAREQQKPVQSRQELGRDKSKTWILFAGGALAALLLFLVFFSSPKKAAPLPGENARGQASLGRKTMPGQDNEAPKNVTPMLSADVRNTDPTSGGQVTPEDVGRTSRTPAVPPPSATSGAPKAAYFDQYALGKVDFSDPSKSIPDPPAAAPALTATPDLKKPSLVFVRAMEVKPTIKLQGPANEETLALPAGTRLVARLQAPVSSAVSAPVVAVVEYNYEREGQIVLPAGAKVFGRLAQVNSSGFVGMQFSRVEMPDGTGMKIEASAMDLNFHPMRGDVSGKKTGTKFLVRSLTGIGTVASYLVGGQGSSSAGVLSTNTLMRERLADNVSTAGQEELNGLAFSQNIVVTVPGNTRFYIVMQKATGESGGSTKNAQSPGSYSSGMGSERVPTLEELRQLLQLRREINELYTQSGSQATASQQQQQ